MKQLKLIVFVLFLAFYSNVLAQIVYTTKTGEKYHIGTCKYLKYSKKELTLDKAKQLGYAACSVCKPTKENTQKISKAKSNTIAPESSKTSPVKKNTATQCKGKTKAGIRCKRMTKSANGRCYQH